MAEHQQPEDDTLRSTLRRLWKDESQAATALSEEQKQVQTEDIRYAPEVRREILGNGGSAQGNDESTTTALLRKRASIPTASP